MPDDQLIPWECIVAKFMFEHIVGPAVVAALRPTGPLRELDLFPLNDAELAKLSLYLGLEIPDK